MPNKVKFIAAGFVLLLIAAGLGGLFAGHESLVRTIESLKHGGPATIALFIAFFIFGTLVFFPLTLLTFSSGVLYGGIAGFALALLSSTLGACAAFILSRYIGRDWLKNKLAKDKRFRAMEEDVSARGWKIVALSRVSFVLPYTLLNYAFGLSQISFSQYALVTLIAMIPSTLLYTYLGSIAGTVAAYFQKHKSFTAVEIIFFCITLAGSLGLLIYIGSIIKRFKGRG